jgi:hypothetical protein
VSDEKAVDMSEYRYDVGLPFMLKTARRVSSLILSGTPLYIHVPAAITTADVIQQRMSQREQLLFEVRKITSESPLSP